MIFEEISNKQINGTAVNNHPEFNHEKVFYYEDLSLNLKSIVAIHSTKAGPAMGGCRFKTYDNFSDGLNDVLRLSRGMTEKNIAANVPFGGGKAIIFANNVKKTPDLFKSFGNFLNLIKGEYISAEDIGITLEDIQLVSQFTPHVFSNVDPSPYTAKGIFYSIEHVLNLFNRSLDKSSIAIQGAGNVGLKLAKLLLDQGSRVIVADTDSNKLVQAQKLGCQVSEDIFLERVDVFSPCAIGGILNKTNISKLVTNFIIGGANNQLLNPEMDKLISAKNIIYIPDAMINAGGVIGLTKDVLKRDEDAIDIELREIAIRVGALLKRSADAGKTPYEIFVSEIIS